MPSPGALLAHPAYRPAARDLRTRVAYQYGERLSLLAFGLVAGFVVAAAVLQVVANVTRGDGPSRTGAAEASLSANAVLTVDTMVRSAPDDAIAPLGNASSGSPLYLLGRSTDARWLLVLVVEPTRASGWLRTADVVTEVDVWELPAFNSPTLPNFTPEDDIDSARWRPTRT
jgi:hypothetical protein